MTSNEQAALLLLGKDYLEYGAVCSVPVGSHAAATITTGADPDSPSHQFKRHPTIKNEDVLCVLDGDDWSGYAVADAHYGPEASHMIMSRLHRTWASDVPGTVDELADMILELRHGDPAETESRTTLVVVIYQRSARQGFGISFGDSSFTILGPDRTGAPLNPHDNHFVTTADPTTLSNGSTFTFSTEPGELLLLNTDGIDGCHYNHPETSIQPEHLLSIAEASSYDPLTTVDGIIAMALKGVDGNPGGQDNIAAITATA